ncbi:invasion associated locus B family protein [Bartonella sp. DGB1]|uniref:invasion associated locus B family protein n=1 Tax=Bartonella sp. DGB1 TaxID=3239807 RepID=UPI003524CD0B
MKRIYLLLIIALVVLVSNPVLAAKPEKMNQYGSWGSYKFIDVNNKKICYILSKPIRSSPDNVNHGENYFLVTKRNVVNNSTNEPQIIAGYNFKKASKVIVTIDSSKFVFFTEDNFAWLANPAEEATFINTMRKGSTMEIQATSARGTSTKYSYSLKGVTSGLQNIQRCN